jgi:ribonuclease E
MLDDEPTSTTEEPTTPPTRRRRAAGRPAGPPVAPAEGATEAAAEAPADVVPERAPAKRTRKKAVAAVEEAAEPSAEVAEAPAPRSRTRKRAAAKPEPEPEAVADETDEEEVPEEEAAAAPIVPLFQAPELTKEQPRRRRAAGRAAGEPAAPAAEDEAAPAEDDAFAEAEDGSPNAARRRRRRGPATARPTDAEAEAVVEETEDAEDNDEDAEDDGTEDGPGGARRRRRRRGGRGRRGRSGAPGEETGEGDAEPAAEADEPAEADGESETGAAGTSRRRRRRRRADDGPAGSDDPEHTVTRVRTPRGTGTGVDEVTSVRGSTRLEAKKQRRREGREAGRRRVPILSEAEFLARREAVDRVMVVRQGHERTQIAVLEDGVLVEHYVNKVSSTSLMGDVYLGRVQNVLPSMEAAFVDIGKGRNAVLYAGEVNFEGLDGQPKRIEHALKSGQSVLVQVTKDPIGHNGVLYAGEVNWDAAGLEGKARTIEGALNSGDAILIQVTKDPIGHKGARLTSAISLPGRYLVYVPEGSMTGISRKLPDTERTRLKNILRQVVPDDAGVIVRTAAEGASEEELRADVERLAAQWEQIAAKAKSASAPALLLGEPDLVVRVVRDVFNEDFTSLIVSGEEAYGEISGYLNGVAPDLASRLSKWTENKDVMVAHRVDEQILKALDRKVWLPSGGSLVIDRTEAMTVVDVNTGKFTGSGGNLEETVTRNNLEAAEEIVRQLRLRDIGGIIVVDFIDMVLENNRELVLRRLVECLGRDRTKHQVAEVTSLGLVQMTRKRVGQGLLEAYSTTCEHCNGRGIMVRTDDESNRRPKPTPSPQPPVTRNGQAPEGGAAVADTVVTEDGAPAAGRSRSSRRRRGRATSAEGEPGSTVVASPDDPDAAPAPAPAAEPEVVVVHPREDSEAEEKAPSAPRRPRKRRVATAEEVPV